MDLVNAKELSSELGSSARVVQALYEALSARDVIQVHKLLAPDIEWWYHGPPNQQHLMRLLTGSSHLEARPLNFTPLSINAFGSMVVVEGYDKEHAITWVHAWTVDENGIIINVREYLNTWLTVTQLDSASSSSAAPSSSSSLLGSSSSLSFQSIWESRHSKTDVPRLLLAI